VNSQHGTPPTSHAVSVRSLDEHMSSDQSFSSAYARAVGAIAGKEGGLTLAQFAAVTDIAGDGKSSAVFTALVLNAIESGVDVDWAFNALSRSSAGIDQAARENALGMTIPLLALHGADARALAQRLAKALSVRLTPEHLHLLPPAEERGILANLGEQARRLVRGRSLADAVADFGRNAGQQALIEHARQFQSGDIDHGQLRELVGSTTSAIAHDISVYLEQAHMLSVGEATAATLVNAANDLKNQVLQRLTLVDQRIAHERRLLVEEIDDAVHDAGNAIELAITDRLNTDQWKDEDVWASMGRNQFGQEMERRLDRIVRRKEQALHLLQEDLRLFQQAMRLNQSSVFQRQHHSTLAKLMPRLRVGTRIVMADVDGCRGRQADAQRMRGQFLRIERDPHRHALHHLDPVAAGVLRRQQREGAAGAGRQAHHLAVEDHLAAVDVGLDGGRLADADVAQFRFLEVGVDPQLVQRHDRQQRARPARCGCRPARCAWPRSRSPARRWRCGAPPARPTGNRPWPPARSDAGRRHAGHAGARRRHCFSATSSAALRIVDGAARMRHVFARDHGVSAASGARRARSSWALFRARGAARPRRRTARRWNSARAAGARRCRGAPRPGPG
jgi:hypothetical protein